MLISLPWITLPFFKWNQGAFATEPTRAIPSGGRTAAAGVPFFSAIGVPFVNG
jgi:hypothetical protein